MGTKEIVMIIVGLTVAAFIIWWRFGRNSKSKKRTPPDRTAPSNESKKADEGKKPEPNFFKKHWGKAVIAVASLLTIWFISNLWIESRESKERMKIAKQEAHKAYCSLNPLDGRCYTEPVLITATSYGSKVIHTPLGRRIEWGPTTHASYAMWYKMGRDTATVEFPKDKAHQELPFPLDSVRFISREATPVTIVLRLK